MPRLHPLRRIASAATLACFVALPATADLAPWDQARATGIAQQLASACDDFEQAVRKQPGIDQVGAGSAGEGFGLGQQARMLREQSQALAGHLAKGKGHDDTRNEWRSLKEVADDVEESAQRSELDAPCYDAKALTP